MISNHIDNEKEVILYLDFNYELGSFNKEKTTSLISNMVDYLKNKKINVDGKKIMLVLGSTLIATFIYANGTFKKIETNKSLAPNIVSINSAFDMNSIKENMKKKNEEEIEITEKETTDIVKNEQEQEPTNQNKTVTKKVESTKTETNKKETNTVKKENTETKQEESKENKTYVTIYRKKGTVEQIELEEYLVGVVAAEMPASFNSEALKAQAVLARTYALKKISKGEKLTDTVSTQAYIDKNEMQNKWGNEYSKYYNKIVSAVNSTKGQVVKYNGNYIEALYHSTSNGKTENAKEVWGQDIPYLKSVDSSWDKKTTSYLKIENKEFNTLMKVLGINFDKNTNIEILSRDESGRVSEVKVADKTYTGVEFRTLLNLRSADFDISVTDNGVEIITRGYGHGVGMSQYGANEMAKLGYNYKNIINHYYTNVKITTQ
jgi:stage II sporulation protein D